MARMSIDDSVARDPRITLLGSLLGLSRHETVGILVCEVWPICYDQRTHLISERMINAAAGRVDFAERMIEAELATRDRSGRVSVTGAKERIRYLEQKSESGRQGGLKSAKARANRSKQTSSTTGSTPQANRNPPVPDSASAPDSVPVPDSPPAPVVVPDGESALLGFDFRHDDTKGAEPTWFGNPASPDEPKKPKKATQLQPHWNPGPVVVPDGVDIGVELERFKDWARANGKRFVDWQAAWRNWVRKAGEYTQKRGTGQTRASGSAAEAFAAFARAGES